MQITRDISTTQRQPPGGGGGCGRVKWSTLRWKPVISDHVTTWRHISQPLAPNLRRLDALDALMRYALQCRTERRRTHLNEIVLLKRSWHNNCEYATDYRAGACVRCCIGAGQRRIVFTHQVAALFYLKWLHGPPSWKCDLKWKLSMHISLKNIPAKFHADSLWNDGFNEALS